MADFSSEVLQFFFKWCLVILLIFVGKDELKVLAGLAFFTNNSGHHKTLSTNNT